MSRWSHATETDVRKALVVEEFGAVSWDEYLRRKSRADPTGGDR